MNIRVRVLFFALPWASLCVAQVPLTIPNGLPSWAYNIPDKVQPPSDEPKGMVRAPGSAKEYDAAKVASNARARSIKPLSCTTRS